MPEMLKKILEWLRHLVGSPSIDDEAAVRAFVRKFCWFAQQIATLTPGKVDDRFVDVVNAVVDSDVVWPEFYAMLKAILGGSLVVGGRPFMTVEQITGEAILDNAPALKAEIPAIAGRLDIALTTVMETLRAFLAALVEILELFTPKG